ncbi:signal transduction histidine kinase [Marinoscillum furvescens DSM 4134]|uniref:histidine kinase n=2 Tax=Marinoscillum furvescens TaxID=1026 RepID=A0A3D9L7X5_MARFU|nr:signal transduction histidine kinase [Marinoscillum furvescens DSM 4134]
MLSGNTFSQSFYDQLAAAKKVSCQETLTFLQKQDTAQLEAPVLADWFKELGLAHYCQGEFAPAVEAYQRAVLAYEQVGNSALQCETINLIGTLIKKQGDYDQARTYFEEGYQLARESGDEIGMGNSLNNLGESFLQQNQPEKALEYFFRSNEHKEAAKDTFGLSFNYDNIAQAYSQLESHDQAIVYFERAAKFKLLSKDSVGYAIVQNNIGEALYQRQQLEEALSYFQKALPIAERANFLDFVQHIYGQMAKVNEDLGDHRAALAHFKQRTAVRDSIFNIAKNKELLEINTRYETEKKERQIAEQKVALQQKNILTAGLVGGLIVLVVVGRLMLQRRRLRYENQLKEEQTRTKEAQIAASIASQEKERSRFAKDLHDGFGQLISILNINLKSLENGANNRQEVFEESAKVLEEMYGELKNICFNLMPQTLIQKGLPAALNEFAARVSVAGKLVVTTDFFGVEERLSDLQEISLYRITQEWVNNIVKYSDAKKVSIQITKDEHELTLMVEDDGSGFDKQKLISGSGNGWKNINSRTNLIHGELELETVIGRRGNSLILNVPVAVHTQSELREA